MKLQKDGTLQAKDLVKIAEVTETEYIDKTPRAYIYAVNAIDDQGNTAPKPLQTFPSIPQGQESEQGGSSREGLGQRLV